MQPLMVGKITYAPCPPSTGELGNFAHPTSASRQTHDSRRAVRVRTAALASCVEP
jgi:hypothetical protein